MRRRSLVIVALAVAATALAEAPPAPTSPTPPTSPISYDEELAAARRAEAQLARKVEGSDGAVRARVRALYKLSAFGDLPFWVDEGAREGALATRGAARRVILRDLEERKILRAELTAASGDVERLTLEAGRAAFRAAQAPLDGSFVRPVDGDVVASFGTYHDDRTHARMLRRGVELHARRPEVVAAAAGQVRWSGPLRGLGVVLVVDHGQGLVTVTSGLAETPLGPGDLVAAGEPVGRAAGARVGFEVRRGGHPVDPFPLLRARR